MLTGDWGKYYITKTKTPFIFCFFNLKLIVGILSLWPSVFWIKFKQLHFGLGLMLSILEEKTQSVLANEKKDCRMRSVLFLFCFGPI